MEFIGDLLHHPLRAVPSKFEGMGEGSWVFRIRRGWGGGGCYKKRKMSSELGLAGVSWGFPGHSQMGLGVGGLLVI